MTTKKRVRSVRQAVRIAGRFARDERGLEIVEWAVLAGLLTAAAAATLAGIGTQVSIAVATLSANL